MTQQVMHLSEEAQAEAGGEKAIPRQRLRLESSATSPSMATTGSQDEAKRDSEENWRRSN